MVLYIYIYIYLFIHLCACFSSSSFFRLSPSNVVVMCDGAKTVEKVDLVN